ncbi:MAG: ABC transporter permease [Roseitalea sp.]|jgi:ribose/xylose/arabinose/galactoside ABC-type transport system permease subunit|nr:ABC transporter permease [Roseitalea sp.]MBO6722676.1 ABC transporter permease [Roseitalea sp.]MBO6741540.1 ABC transporter permease [Roseitalea sp.]
MKRLRFIDSNILILASLFLIAGLVSPHFWTPENLLNVARAASLIGIIAIGMNVVIITGGIDLSVGSVVALVGALAASFTILGLPIYATVFLTLAVAALVGLVNGSMVAHLGFQPFVATLVMMTIVRGVGLVYTDGQPIYVDYPPAIEFLSRGELLGLPVPAILFVLVTLVTWYVMRFRTIGRQMYTIGSNERAACLAGVPVRRTKLIAYVYCSVLAGLSGLILTARMGSGEPGQAGVLWELDAIAAVVIGGTALLGGRGSVWGAFVGALVIGILSNLFNLMGVDPEWQNVAKGAIILLAVLVPVARGWIGVNGDRGMRHG